jgi:hypothetical protein
MEHRDETSADIGMEDRGRMKLPTGMSATSVNIKIYTPHNFEIPFMFVLEFLSTYCYHAILE